MVSKMNDENTRKAYEEQEKRIAEAVSRIKHRIAVFSGKGGVGKTTVSVNLALGFQTAGLSAGILDADITGPNVAKMLSIISTPVFRNNRILPFEKYGLKVISFASLIKAGEAVVWRGPLRSKMINQFLSDVEWNDLDCLIADLPPGTGDEILTIAQEMKPDSAIIVTTPQEVSVIDAERAINMARALKIPFIGVVENMSGLVCPHCKNKIDLFGSGGGMRLASEYGVPLLGSIPIDIDACTFGDKGEPILLQKPECAASKILKSIAEQMIGHYQMELQRSGVLS